MARLKRDHSSWTGAGLFRKYQQPAIDETIRVSRKKKNTKKWCRGKVGVEHRLERYFWRRSWQSVRAGWVRTRCVNCRKEFNSNDKSVPLRIELDDSDYRATYPIQVKANGKAIPFDYCELENLRLQYWHWCERCEKMH